MLESTDKSYAYRNAKIAEILQMVDEIYSKNQKLYSNHLFERAIKSYQEEKQKEKDRIREHEETLSRIDSLTTQLNNTVNQLNAQVARNQQLSINVTNLRYERANL